MRQKIDIESTYNIYVNDLFTYALYLGFKKETIRDAVHDVFCKLATDKGSLDDITNIKQYLFRAVKNRLLDIHKTQKRHLEISNTTLNEALPFSINVSTEELLINKERQRIIKEQINLLLDSLTPRQREIIYLRYIQEFSYEAISQQLDISVHGCRKLVSKAIMNLREKYGSLILLLLLSVR